MSRLRPSNANAYLYLATGGIAKSMYQMLRCPLYPQLIHLSIAFTKDLMIDPSTRSVSDLKHTVVAAASSSSADRAKKILEECKCPSSAAAYGSYEELVKDKNIDIVYVATPHSHHYQNTMLCLEAGKHVLCEKAFTVNAAQAKKLVETAKRKKLFLMEAVWTRYFPLSIRIRQMIEDGELGPIHRVIADNSFGKDVEKEWDDDHRMVNLDLAGGAMLDREFSQGSSPFFSPTSYQPYITRALNPSSLKWASILSLGSFKLFTTHSPQISAPRPPFSPP